MSYLGVVASGILTTNQTSQVLTVATAVAAGGTVIGAVVWDSADNSIPTVSSIVDSRGNSYVTDDQVAGGTTVALVQFRGRITNALEVGDTITITITPGHYRWATKVLGYDDVLQAMALSPLDVHTNNPAVNSTSMYSGQVTVSQDRVLLVTSHGLGINRTFTAPGGWTETTSVETNAGSSDRAVKMLFRYTTVSGAYSETTTISPTGTNAGIIAAYKVIPNRKNYSRVEHRFEGLASGTVLTTSNTGGAAGVAYNSIVGLPTATSTQSYKGTRSSSVATSSSTTTYGQDTSNLGPSRTVRGRCVFRMSGNPAANASVIETLNASTVACRVQVTTGGLIRVADSTGAQMSTSGTTAIPTNQWVRIEWRFVASATVGQATVKVWFTPDSTGTPDISLTSAASFNTQSRFDGYACGLDFSSLQTYGVFLDEIVWTTDDNAEVGIYPDVYTLTTGFEGASPLAAIEATGNANVTASALKLGSAGLRLASQTVAAYLETSSLTFGSGRRYASLAAWMRQPSGSLTADCVLATFKNTDPTAGVAGGHGKVWVDHSTGFIKADLYGPTAMTGTGNVTTTSSTSATSLTGNKPANVSDGDLLWAVFFHKTAGATITPPSGWTIRKSDNAGNATFCFATKPVSSASAETPTTYAFSTSGTAARCILHIGRIVGADLSSPVDVAGATSGYTGTGTLTLPGVTTTVAKTRLIGVATNNTTTSTVSSFTAAPGMAEVSQTSIVSGSTTSDVQVAQEFVSAAGATGNRVATISPTSANTGGFLIAIKPASPLTGASNLSSNWFYLQAVCAYKDTGESLLKIAVNGVEIGILRSGIPVVGEALDAVTLGSRSVIDATMDVDALELSVADTVLDYIGSPGTPGPYVRSGALWKTASPYVRVAGSWVAATAYVRSGGSWVIAG